LLSVNVPVPNEPGVIAPLPWRTTSRLTVPLPLNVPPLTVTVPPPAAKLLLTHFSNRYDDDRSKLVGEAQAVFKDSVEAKEGLEILV
jgi:hypothetical protein